MVTSWKYGHYVTSCISIIGHSGPAWGGGGGGGVGGSSPQVQNPLGGYLKFKNQCHFQYDTTES